MLTLKDVRTMKKLTLDDLKELQDEMLPPWAVAKFVGGDPYALNLKARRNPELMEFPFFVHGKRMTRVSFPRQGLIAWAEGNSMQYI